MSSDLFVLALLVVVVVAGSALCSGVEAALLTVNPLRIHELAVKPRPIAGARRLAKLRPRLGRTLSVLVIANKGFNIFGSVIIGSYVAIKFKGIISMPVFRDIPLSVPPMIATGAIAILSFWSRSKLN